ncbi:hypothetical protein B0H34DRAFT_164905 [Crassisporium funariophilum]|nr:hypothetical protein B0H34DRAFT_164905 [Crassisporium funariophilum]
MELEEGQILPDDVTESEAYDPSYEWPGDEANEPDDQLDTPQSTNHLKSNKPVFRFVVLRSSILQARHRVAVIDSYSEVQLGRDAAVVGTVIPRVRLKEMEVSKLHATAYWDGARREWNVLDMGSMHGTFLKAGPVPIDSNNTGARLSPSRTASLPRRLRHSDQLTIGGTTFVVHIHDDQMPCQDCSISGNGDEIPLFPAPKKLSVKRTRDSAGLDSDTSTSSSTQRDPKKALSMLKRSLLTRHDIPKHGSSSTVSVGKSSEYVDRAARRRSLHPSSRPDTPGISSSSFAPTATTDAPLQLAEQTAIASPVVSQPPIPLPATNIGHQLLMKQGWTPGNALGTPSEDSEGRVGLVEPLEVKSTQNRAGLGVKHVVVTAPESSSSGMNWKEREKMKRFQALR